MTITREIRAKVIQLSKDGHGRNEIARMLSGQGLHISEGSVGNITRAYRKHEQPLQNHSSYNDNNSSVSIGVGLKKTGTPILARLENGVGQADIATIGTNSKSNVTIHRNGGPLLQILGNDSTDEVIAPDSPPPSIVSIPPTEQNRNLSIKEVNIIDVNNSQYVAKKNETAEEEDEYEHSGSSLPTTQNTTIKLGMDWDSDENYERRVVRFIMGDKKQRRQDFQLLEQRRLELEEERRQIEQMNQWIKQRENNLKVREAKVAEIESLAPSVKQLQQMNVTFDMMMSYIILVNERSVLGNVSPRSAALSLSHDFKEYRSLGNILKAKQEAEHRLSELDMLITQRQAALNGIAERLTQLTGSSHNNNNGHGDLSMTDYIRLNMLRSRLSTTTTRMAI